MKQNHILDPNICFRSKDLSKARKLINLKESFNVTGIPSVGKSRFLRHLSSQKSFATALATPTSIVYIDLRNCVDENLLDFINSSLVASNISTLENLETWFESNLALYIIFDESMELLKHDIDLLKQLRAYRDRFKYRLNYVFSYDNLTAMNYSQKSLFEVAKYNINLEPLVTTDMIDTINYILSGYNHSLNNEEILRVVTQAKGFPGRARSIILNNMLGGEVEPTKLTLEKETLLEKSLYYLTKNEYLVFKTMLGKQNYFIEKDEIALIISPDSEGIGVSDSAIAQLIRRLRVKLAENNANVSIKTKRGFGYMLS